MDIEKVIEDFKEQATDILASGADMDESDWLCHSGVIVTGNEARALLTELEYWKARCEAAETRINRMAEKTEDYANAEPHFLAVAGAIDKARYLETLKTGTDGQ